MTVHDFPRLLVVTSNNFNLVTGGGIMLTNLFRGWPADRIANLHEDPTPEDHSVCRNFYRLSQEEIHWVWPFSLAEPWRSVEVPAIGSGPASGNRMSALSVDGVEGEAVWLRWMRRVLGDGMPRTARITDRLTRWLETFQPEVLYGFLGSMAQIRLVRELAKALAIPVVVHIMDNWPIVLYRRGLLGPLLRRVVRSEFEEVLRNASVRMGICEDMCGEYSQRYGYSFLAFHNALDMEEWLPHAKRNWRAGSPFIVRYVGSILPDGQRESLREVCEAIAGLRASGASLEMWVHAPKEQATYLHNAGIPFEGIHLEGPPSPDSIARLLAGADLLVLPFNFDARSAEYIRLSMPTKIPAYMASGTPILVYGPPRVAAVRYAQGEGWGCVVSTGGVPALQKTLLQLMADQAVRERLGRRAQELARQRHDAAKVRPAFWDALAAASGTRRLAYR